MVNASGPDNRMTASPPSPRGVAMAAMVSSDISTMTRSIFGVAALEEHPRFFVTSLVHVVQQIGIRAAREFCGQFVEARKKWHQVRFGICGGHGLHRFLQF